MCRSFYEFTLVKKYNELLKFCESISGIYCRTVSSFWVVCVLGWGFTGVTLQFNYSMQCCGKERRVNYPLPVRSGTDCLLLVSIAKGQTRMLIRSSNNQSFWRYSPDKSCRSSNHSCVRALTSAIGQTTKRISFCEDIFLC